MVEIIQEGSFSIGPVHVFGGSLTDRGWELVLWRRNQAGFTILAGEILLVPRTALAGFGHHQSCWTRVAEGFSSEVVDALVLSHPKTPCLYSQWSQTVPDFSYELKCHLIPVSCRNWMST